VRTHGIPRKLEAAVETARTGIVRELDLGLAAFRSWDGSEAHTYFANIASAGMSGAVARRANETTKALGGKVSYAWATLAVFVRWQQGEMRVAVDGEERSGRMHDVIVAIGRFLAGGMKITPEAEPDDGLFDVLVIGAVTKRDLVLTLPKIYRGTHLPHPKAELLRGRLVEIDAADALPIQVDGEQPGTTPVRFEIVPRALRVRCPG
jgi:diacylglycerol kinase (ATP)